MAQRQAFDLTSGGIAKPFRFGSHPVECLFDDPRVVAAREVDQHHAMRSAARQVARKPEIAVLHAAGASKKLPQVGMVFDVDGGFHLLTKMKSWRTRYGADAVLQRCRILDFDAVGRARILGEGRQLFRLEER